MISMVARCHTQRTHTSMMAFPILANINNLIQTEMYHMTRAHRGHNQALLAPQESHCDSKVSTMQYQTPLTTQRQQMRCLMKSYDKSQSRCARKSLTVCGQKGWRAQTLYHQHLRHPRRHQCTLLRHLRPHLSATTLPSIASIQICHHLSSEQASAHHPRLCVEKAFDRTHQSPQALPI